MSKIAIIVGAGPAGLTTAYQLLKTTEILPVILERSGDPKGETATSYHRMGVIPYRILSRLKRYFFTSIDSIVNCEAVAWQVQEMGGNIHFHHHIYATYTVGKEVCSIHAINGRTGELTLFRGDYFFSTVPIYDLISGVQAQDATQIKSLPKDQYKYNNLFIIDKRANNRQIFKTLS